MGIDVLIPVLGRPQNIHPLLESLKVTRERYRVFFICSPEDAALIEICESTDAETWVVDWSAGIGDFAKKINWAYEHTDSEWVFQGATDIKFYPGWDTYALALAASRERTVIGTNDLHNPQVKRRMQSTHTLFARSYIEEYGGTTDNTGKVFCELYDHQYVDNEFCETAIRRGTWAFSMQSIVEHLHPHWGLAPTDSTYKKAMRMTSRDYRLFHKRMGRSLSKARDERRRLREEQRLKRMQARARR